jgi:hypothetical protein
MQNTSKTQATIFVLRARCLFLKRLKSKICACASILVSMQRVGQPKDVPLICREGQLKSNLSTGIHAACPFLVTILCSFYLGGLTAGLSMLALREKFTATADACRVPEVPASLSRRRFGVM